MVVFWFRRDLRLKDNRGLCAALQSGEEVLPLFIFDEEIISELPRQDHRISFIYDSILKIHSELKAFGSGLIVKKGNVLEVWKELLSTNGVSKVFTNEDYEPYARSRDGQVKAMLAERGLGWEAFKDQVVFAGGEILKADSKPYTVFTPFKNKWLLEFEDAMLEDSSKKGQGKNFAKLSLEFPQLENLGFDRSTIAVKPFDLSGLDNYAKSRDFPAMSGTSNLGPHLRFGTVSVREMYRQARRHTVFTSELIWREFFMQILWHFPEVVKQNFKSKYDGIQWRNHEGEFDKWCTGMTGYPLVDAGMRELNATGYMHNRVRMLVASFLCKHLLIDWRWGEAYFARKLFDYELASNNGNWQWAAGTGCDAAPYFRIFNPRIQVKKFDFKLEYIRKWVPELDSLDYPSAMVDHKLARERALKVYKEGIGY